MKLVSLMSRRRLGWWSLGTAGLALAMITYSGLGFAAKGGIPGPPTGGETSNNLSMPAVQTESATSTAAQWLVPAEPVMGTHFSYGCDQEEQWQEFTYPNTTCVADLDAEVPAYLTREACIAVEAPCEGFTVDQLFRIYHQKVDVNEWWADDEGISMEDPPKRSAAFVDWGDALEAVSWTERSKIRVETQPYSSTFADDPLTTDVYEATFDPAAMTCAEAASARGLDPALACKTGFQMWHAFGQGITEHWGVRATEAGVSFNYDTPFQIIKTTKARLNLTKLVAGSALCSEPGDNPGDPAPVPEDGVWNWAYNEVAGRYEWSDELAETYTIYDDIYTVETSVGGKYVYGYNWNMADVVMPEGWERTGFWRLTFYAYDDIDFDNPVAPNVAPPASPGEARDVPVTTFTTVTAPSAAPVAEEESDEEDPDADDRLYRPAIDVDNNLTYLDICVKGKSSGGGGGGKGGGKGGGRK